MGVWDIHTLKEYNKAVRDRIPEIIHSQGKTCEVKELENQAFLRYIEYKLIEELEEYLESKEPEELADLLEVVYRVAQLQGVLPEELEQIRQKKAEEWGCFAKNRVLVSVEEEKTEPERKMLLCTCERGNHVFEDE